MFPASVTLASTEPVSDGTPAAVAVEAPPLQPPVVNTEKRTLANTLAQCHIIQKAQYLSSILSAMADTPNRQITQDFVLQPDRYISLGQTALDVHKFVKVLMRNFRHVHEHVRDPQEAAGMGDLEVGYPLKFMTYMS